ncbi:MAG: hypothetical protein K8R68_09275, partial [Bacteroidales bacterium]|nr:hypothetical protein [Bacteroidales bacterium]
MKSKTLIVFFILTIFLVSGFVTQSFAQDSKQLFQEGLMKENGEGNLPEAISIYEKIVADESAENSVKAKAQLHIGLCYEKLGKTEAKKAYELVLQNYKNYEDEVQVASLRLSELSSEEEEDNAPSVINLYYEGPLLENSALSPDGTKLAGIDFSIGQNVAVYDRLTTKTQLITQYEWSNPDDGHTYFPIWSPDGKEIVYMFFGKNGICELQASTLEGKKRTLIKNEPRGGQIYPRQWSQDGSEILTFKQDTTGFYTIGIVPARGGSFKAIYNTQWKGRFIKGDASLSPDGKFVVFADGQEDNLDIFIIDTEGGTPTVLSDHPVTESNPLWSPDGKHIAFIKKIKGGSLLYAIEMAEGKPVGLPFLIKEGLQDVDLINWTEHGISYNLQLDIREIYTLSLDPETGTPAGDPKPLDYTPAGSNICPVWSHDGKYLAFISYADKPDVVILPVEGGETRYYTIPASEFWAPGVQDLNWLPDNSGVGFNIINSMDLSTIYRLDLITGKWQDWSLPGKGWSYTNWGPDENSIMYTKRAKPNPGLYQFDIKTGETRHIFQPDSGIWLRFGRMKFSRDHKKLTFKLNDKRLMVMDLGLGKNRMLTQKCWSPIFSPDGQKIMAIARIGNEKNAPMGVIVLSLDGEILQQYN